MCTTCRGRHAIIICNVPTGVFDIPHNFLSLLLPCQNLFETYCLYEIQRQTFCILYFVLSSHWLWLVWSQHKTVSRYCCVIVCLISIGKERWKVMSKVMKFLLELLIYPFFCVLGGRLMSWRALMEVMTLKTTSLAAHVWGRAAVWMLDIVAGFCLISEESFKVMVKIL